MYYFVVGGVIDGMCGGIGAFLFSSFAYVADTSTEEERTKKISLSESMICLGGFVASITGINLEWDLDIIVGFIVGFLYNGYCFIVGIYNGYVVGIAHI